MGPERAGPRRAGALNYRRGAGTPPDRCNRPQLGVASRRVSWTFVYLMLGLKIPILCLLYLVWWAIHQTDDTETPSSDDGGTKHPPHPRRPFPRLPRRGPHGDPPQPAPRR